MHGRAEGRTTRDQERDDVARVRSSVLVLAVKPPLNGGAVLPASLPLLGLLVSPPRPPPLPATLS